VQGTNEGMESTYYLSFVDWCIDAGNTKETCERFTDQWNVTIAMRTSERFNWLVLITFTTGVIIFILTQTIDPVYT